MLSICILHYNRKELTDACLHSVQSQHIPFAHEVLVLDNGSDVPYTTYHATVRRLDANVGHIEGQNECLRAARYDYVLFVSNDVRLQRGCVNALWEAVTGRWGQLMPQVHNPDGTVQCAGMAWRWPGYGVGRRTGVRTTQRTPIVPSICYLTRRSIIEAIGWFDASLWLAYEDVDMGLRLGDAGYRDYVVPAARATHVGNATLGPLVVDPRGAFHQARCRLILKRYRGVDAAVRLATVALLDAALGRRHSRPRSMHTPSTA